MKCGEVPAPCVNGRRGRLDDVVIRLARVVVPLFSHPDAGQLHLGTLSRRSPRRLLSRERPDQQRFRLGALPIGRIHERHGIEKVRLARRGFEGAARYRAHSRQCPIKIAPPRIHADQLGDAQQRARVLRVNRQRRLVRGYPSDWVLRCQRAAALHGEPEFCRLVAFGDVAWTPRSQDTRTFEQRESLVEALLGEPNEPEP